MSESQDMQELFKEAAKIAAVVPESMQEAAFHRALDLLTGNGQTPVKRTTTPRRASKERSSGGGGAGTAKDDRVGRVMAISRDDIPEVDQETTVLGRSVALLVAASREANVDGLTAPEIARILTEKFRHRTTRQAVLQALDSSGNMVDRQKSGNSAAVYRVMNAGEDWLAKPSGQRTAASNGARSRRPKAKKAAAPSPAKTASTKKTSNSATKAGRRATTGRKTGPKAVLETLINEGYFSEPRDIADIRSHIRDQKALSFDSHDLSPALTRLLREGKLKRNKAEKQYVYTSG
jgi:hypothetical protein